MRYSEHTNIAEEEILAKIFSLFDMNKQYDTEADLLVDTKLFLNLIPDLYYMRVFDSHMGGKPDIVVCYRGRFIAIELKDITGVTSKLQVCELCEIRNAGGEAVVCQTMREVRDAIFIRD